MRSKTCGLNRPLFDHFVGADKKRRWDGDNECLGSLRLIASSYFVCACTGGSAAPLELAGSRLRREILPVCPEVCLRFNSDKLPGICPITASENAQPEWRLLSRPLLGLVLASGDPSCLTGARPAS